MTHLDETTRRMIADAYARGDKVRDIAAAYDVSVGTVANVAARAGIPPAWRDRETPPRTHPRGPPRRRPAPRPR